MWEKENKNLKIVHPKQGPKVTTDMLVTGGLASSSYPATVGNTGSWLVGTSPTLYPPKDAPVEERKYQFQPLKCKAPLAAEWSRPLLQAQEFPIRSQAGADDWNYGESWRFPVIQLLQTPNFEHCFEFVLKHEPKEDLINF